MIVKDPGHWYVMDTIDGPQVSDLIFVKREGANYPGNVGRYPGVQLQEVLRCCIDRAKYLETQQPCKETQSVIDLLRGCLWVLEARTRRIRKNQSIMVDIEGIENLPTCKVCGHIECEMHK